MYSQDTKIFQLIPPVKFLFIQAYVHAVSGGFFFRVWGFFAQESLEHHECIVPSGVDGTKLHYTWIFQWDLQQAHISSRKTIRPNSKFP